MKLEAKNLKLRCKTSMLSLSVKKLVFSYSRMTHNQNNTFGRGGGGGGVDLTFTCKMVLLLLVYNFVLVHNSLIPWSTGQLRQGGWTASCCKCARLKNWFSTQSTWLWPLAWSQTSNSYLLNRNMLSFSFIHFIHSAKGKQPSPAFSSILPTNFSCFHFFVSLTFGP